MSDAAVTAALTPAASTLVRAAGLRLNVRSFARALAYTTEPLAPKIKGAVDTHRLLSACLAALMALVY